MTEQDIQAWEREINHAQMMWRLAYKHEVNKRNEQMAWNEAQANQAMAATIEQDRQNDIASINERARIDKQLERQRRNSEFWHRIMHIAIFFTFVAIIIRFWG